MPWVFLHAIKDYYEMPWLISLYPGVKATFNLSASLIEQLNLYHEPLKNDYFLSLWAKDVTTLAESEREWLIKLIKAMQFETMVRPLKRYAELYYKTDIDDAELIDLEVSFMLAWCGNYLRLHHDTIKALLNKGKGYSSEDKHLLLNVLSTFVQTILPFYQSLQDQEIISVSTTPYFHPILPVLLDMENAKRANSVTDLPRDYCELSADAYEHVQRSIQLYQKTFGRSPNGFWPAEGAVDEKSLRIYKESSIQWIATDEAILAKSLNDADPALKFKPYIFDDVTIGFRDHYLSDLIGFEYRHRKGEDASFHFMGELEKIALSQEDPTVFVIVDGENAWEFYENNGYEFFMSLYENLSSSSWCKTYHMDDVSALKDQRVLEHLAPGSWIHGTFDTWVGHHEKNRAWELIFQTQRDVISAKERLSNEAKELVQYHLLAAECSDWFWWYGDDHSTDFAHEFDELFREHLIHIYRVMELDIPHDLLIPIISDSEPKPFWIKPKNSISPRMNGKMGLFDWIGCGSIDERLVFSTMDRLRGPIDIIYYGYDKNNLYIALEGEVDSSYRVEVDVADLVLPLEPLFLKNRMECRLPREALADSGTVSIRLRILDEDKTLQSIPGFGPLVIDFNELCDWYI